MGTYRSARGVGSAGMVIGCLVLASTAAASGMALPNACTLLAGAHPERVFGHGKTLAATHRKSQKYGAGKYATFQCSETVGTQPISLSVAYSNGGFGGVKSPRRRTRCWLGSGAKPPSALPQAAMRLWTSSPSTAERSISPQTSLVRFVQQAMVVASIVLPAMLAARTVDMARSLFLCFAASVILNLLFVLGGSVTIAQYGSMAVDIGYQGYFLGKNYLGECAAVALILALHETRYPGWRRALGIVVVVVALSLVFLSDSKTALGLAFISPFLAGLTLIVRKVTRLSPAIILLSIPLCYMAVSSVSNFNMNRMSYHALRRFDLHGSNRHMGFRTA